MNNWSDLTGAGCQRAEIGFLSESVTHDGETFEPTLRHFRKQCQKAGILSELRKHRQYEKPIERRERKPSVADRENRRSRTA